LGKIVWLASYPKSGNTWLRVFLHNYIKQPDAPYSINKLTDLSASECNAAFFEKHILGAAGAYTTQEVQRARPKVHQDLTHLHDDLVFIKTHNANRAVHGIPLCTQAVSAGAIYIIRDPRDVAVSYAAYTGRALDDVITFMAEPGAANRGTGTQVFEFLGTWSGHAESWTAGPKFLRLRYEDMLEDTAREFGRVIRYLGGDPDPARLAKAVAFSDFATLSKQEAADGYQAGSPTAAPFFRQGRAGRWREVLNDTQRARIELQHSALMKRFGYLP
jgi:hypothetical protein